VRAHVPEREELVHPDGTRVEYGHLPDSDWHVAFAELGEGNGATAALTTQIVNWLEPQAICRSPSRSPPRCSATAATATSPLW
jgi:hypothetical protein